MIRGAGRQSLGAAVNLVAYWMLGVPFAIFLGFRAGMGVMGFWIGMAATTVLQGVSWRGSPSASTGTARLPAPPSWYAVRQMSAATGLPGERTCQAMPHQQ